MNKPKGAWHLKMPGAFLGVLLSLLLFVPAGFSNDRAPQRSLFVSVVQKTPMLSSKEEMLKMIQFSKEARIQTLFIQLFQSHRAWFKSEVGDSAPYEECRKTLGEDPFLFLLKNAHAAGLKVHVWVNLLSIGINTNAPIIKKYGPEVLTRNRSEKKNVQDYRVDNHFFLEPGDPRVRFELGKMVEEILTAYPEVDGIQFDYIRYPDTRPDYGYTPMNLARFEKATGMSADKARREQPTWEKWRHAQVTELLTGLVKTARRLRPGIQVSTTGLTPYTRATYESYQDWKDWISSGLTDFVTIMDYSMDNDYFKRMLGEARTKSGAAFGHVNVAVGAYKMVDDPSPFAPQWEFCEAESLRECAVFHYGSLLENPELKKPLLNQPKS